MTLPTAHDIIAILSREGLAGRRRIEEQVRGSDDIRILGQVLTEATEPRVRRVAASILAAVADPGALPALLTALADPDPQVVALAADAAGNSAYARDIPDDLRRDLGDRLLARLTDPGSPRPVRTGAEYALGLLRYSPAAPALIEALDDDQPIVRWNAAEALSHIGGGPAVDALRRRAEREEDPEVRRYLTAALRALRA